MELSIDLAQQIFSMVLICCVGYLLARLDVVSPDQSHVLSRVSVYVFTPCSILQSFQSELNSDQLSGLALAFIGAAMIYIVTIPLLAFAGKSRLRLSPEEQASCIYSNAGNLGIPLISGIASLGPSYVFYMSAFFAIQNALIWSHGVTLMSGERQIHLKKILQNPAILSIGVGLILFFCQISLPSPIQTTVSSLAACLGPVCMLVIGLSLGGQDLKFIFSSKRIYGVTSIRLILLPMITMVPFYILSRLWVHPDLENILIVMFICALGPAAASIAQLAQLYHHPNGVYVSAINVVSTLFCAITMPIMVLLFQLLLHM